MEPQSVSSPACELFRRCIHLQQPQDWQVFVEHYCHRVAKTVAWAFSRLAAWPSIDEPEDITQELYCRLLSGAASEFRGETEGELWTYLGQVVFHLLLDRQRQRTAAKRTLPRAYTPVRPEYAPSTLSSPEETTLTSERRRLFLISCAIGSRGARSGPRLRALWLAIVGGWSSQEAARVVGGSLSGSQLDSMIHRLRRRLEAQGLHLPRRSVARAI